jgi:type IV secretion system protein VirD4
MRRRATAGTRWGIAAAVLIGLIALIPSASWVYAQLAHVQFTPWVWIAGFVHQLDPDALYQSGIAGLVTALAVPGFTAWALLPKKPLHGEARLARQGEAKKAGLYRDGGQSIVLGRHRGKLLVFNGDLHVFVAAATGTGKGVGFVVPNLLHWQGSVLCIDIKGENYAITSGYRAGPLKQAVYRFDPLEEEGRTHRFNPLAYISAGERRINDIQTLAANLIPAQGKDPYWEDAARDLFIGLALLTVEAGPHLKWPVSIGQVNRLVRTEKETAEHLKDLLKNLKEQGIEISETCRRYILSWCNEPQEPRGSIKSTLATKLTLWSSPLVDRATEANDFDLRDFRRKPISLYISIAPDDLKKLAPLIRVLVETFLSLNTKAGETPDAQADLKVPVLLMLDEFLSLGPMVKLVDALAYVRGWGIKIATVIQSEAQLQALYGREHAESYIDNHRARIYYRPPTHRRDLADGIAKMIGQRTVKQTSYSFGQGRRSRQVSETGQQILSSDEIANLSDDETIVLVDGIRPLLANKLRYYRDKLFAGRAMAPLPLPPTLQTARQEEGEEQGEAEAEQDDAAAGEAQQIEQDIAAIEIPEGIPTPEDLKRIAEQTAAIARPASRGALALLPPIEISQANKVTKEER